MGRLQGKMIKKILPNKKKADKLAGDIVKKRDGRCLNCYTTHNLQWAHLISRSYYQVRWDLNNSVALCAKCHMYFTYHPLEWEDWCIDYLGEGGWQALKKKALAYKKINYKEVMAELADYRI